jgi:hypothetical protein
MPCILNNNNNKLPQKFNHRLEFIRKTGKHFLPDYPNHKQRAKFCLIKFEGKVHEICVFLP